LRQKVRNDLLVIGVLIRQDESTKRELKEKGNARTFNIHAHVNAHSK